MPPLLDLCTWVGQKVVAFPKVAFVSFAECTAYMFTIALSVIMLQAFLIIGADAASLLAWPFSRAPGQAFSKRWCMVCLASWLCTLGVASPMLVYAFQQPVLVALTEATMASELYIQLVQSMLGPERSSALPSSVIHNAVKSTSEMSAASGQQNQVAENLWMVVGFVAHLYFGYNEYLEAPIASSVIGGVFVVAMLGGIYEVCIGDPTMPAGLLKTWQTMWITSLPSVHLGCFEDDTCEEHGDCAVCLEPLCTSTERTAAVRRLQGKMASSLSVCRLGLRSRAHSFSASRSTALDAGQAAGSGIWRCVATLQCRHKFHTGCIFQAVKAGRVQCPTCRRELGASAWSEVPMDAKCLVIIGGIAITLFQVVARYSPMILTP